VTIAKNTVVTIKTICKVDKAQNLLADILDDNLAYAMTKENMASKTEDPRFLLNVLWHLARIVDVCGQEEAYKHREVWRPEETFPHREVWRPGEDEEEEE
jgi:hypothetical protein